jgi:hypothetical protein
MTKLSTRARHGNGVAYAKPLPLMELLERRRWDEAPRAARWVARRCRIASPSAARAIAELAGLEGER